MPSLSSLMATLEEVENGDARAVSEKDEEEEEARTASAEPEPRGAFHRFGELPPELRIKIWELSLLARVVELRPTRPNYSAAHDDGRQAEVRETDDLVYIPGTVSCLLFWSISASLSILVALDSTFTHSLARFLLS